MFLYYWLRLHSATRPLIVTINISCDIAVTTGFPWVCPAESKRMFSEILAHAIIPTVKPHRNSDSIRGNTCKNFLVLLYTNAKSVASKEEIQCY